VDAAAGITTMMNMVIAIIMIMTIGIMGKVMVRAIMRVMDITTDQIL
jgi:hypothetical protein